MAFATKKPDIEQLVKGAGQQQLPGMKRRNACTK
jgi:hypothetical protein